MRNLSGNAIREEFLRFFEGKGHRRVHSSSLVPQNDPTLLFTNAGMNQFKDVFLGAETRAYTRAATSQKCVRAGGKHNDLENVGFTRRHHTFFEMLGNFSFGDYFKKDAIAFAWELLTSEEWFGIDTSRLYVTIFAGEGTVPRDDEAERLWIEAGVPKERIFEMSAKDNFWQMGDTGPCGPCSEIFFDLGLAASETGEDLPFPQDDQRYMEIWNLVFMQFDRVLSSESSAMLAASIPETAKYDLEPLPKPSIDTGMGLERIACVLQGVLSNYDTDLFTPLLKRAAEITMTKFGKNPVMDASLRVIADHARAATFLVSDGVVPGPNERGSVLRKIIRRALKHGRYLMHGGALLSEMAVTVAQEFRSAYPELEENLSQIQMVLRREETSFGRTLSAGFSALEDKVTRELEPFCSPESPTRQLLLDVSDSSEQHKRLEILESLFPTTGSPRGGWQQVRMLIPMLKAIGIEITFPGQFAFFLYDSLGFPEDFTQENCIDLGLNYDHEGFLEAMEEQRTLARASWKGGSQKSAAPVYRELAKTEFEGYSALRVDGARVLALVKDGLGVAELRAGEMGEVVLDATSFYADSGGQVGDVGWLYAADHQTVVAEVTGCKKPVQGVFAHAVVMKQTLVVGDVIDTVVNGEVRAAVMRNHTATHLMQAALREVLGRHVKQAGSLNDAKRLRFDFSHFAGVAEEELADIESLVNAQVLKNVPVQTMVDVPIDVAVHELGAMALFGEKYGDRVRVVKIGDFSTELCGGTHTAATGEIGLVKLVGESAVASGVRRVEAVTGTGALGLFRRDADVARVASSFVGGGDVSADGLRARVSQQEEEMKKLRRELEQMHARAASASVQTMIGEAVNVKGIKVLSKKILPPLGRDHIRSFVDELRTKLLSGVVVLGWEAGDGKVSLIVGVTKDLTSKLMAGKIVGALAAKVGGKGGGRPDLAEAGGTDVAALVGALDSAKDVVGEMLG